MTVFCSMREIDLPGTTAGALVLKQPWPKRCLRAKHIDYLGHAADRAEAAPADGQARPEAMGAKNDLVVWLRLQPAQQRIYEVLTCPPLPAPLLMHP